MNFLRHKAIQEEGERAAQKAESAKDNVWDVVFALLKVDETTNAEIAPLTESPRAGERAMSRW